MFNRKKIIALEARVSELEAKAEILADRLCKAYKELNGVYEILADMKPVENPVVAEQPVAEPKPKKKHRPRKKNGKEDNKAAE